MDDRTPPTRFGLGGKRALVVGGASGIGAAAARIVAELGASVVVLDHRPVAADGVESHLLDLREQASIDEALGGIEGAFDVVLCCAGVAGGTPGMDRVNFTGQRHLIESLLASGRLPRGSAVGMIASLAGLGWERNLDVLGDYLDTPDFATAVAWIEKNADQDTYAFSKRAVCAYVARRACALATAGVRINAILPGPTDTPLARANADMWLQFGKDYRDAVGGAAATPEQQAGPLVFLCTPAAGHVNGVNLVVDGGYVSSAVTETFAAPAVRAMVGLPS
ncbi:SDR family oxidoreductase [Pseudonocardia sp. GCM10023141]|uniref:SDR family oxidoreductase n=1 Tax=Pseudonocardia sp. GCM10023141 TaxID=3252653 RepID=UPI0036108D88